MNGHLVELPSPAKIQYAMISRRASQRWNGSGPPATSGRHRQRIIARRAARRPPRLDGA